MRGKLGCHASQSENRVEGVENGVEDANQSCVFHGHFFVRNIGHPEDLFDGSSGGHP